MDLDDIFVKNRYDAGEDHSIIEIDDTRKIHLTLAHVNKLRRIKEAKKFEQLRKLKRMKEQYSDSEQPGP